MRSSLFRSILPPPTFQASGTSPAPVQSWFGASRSAPGGFPEHPEASRRRLPEASRSTPEASRIALELPGGPPEHPGASRSAPGGLDSALRFVHSLLALLFHSSWMFYRRESAESHKANTLSMHNIGTVQEHAASSSIAAVLHNVKGGRVGLDASLCIFEYTC